MKKVLSDLNERGIIKQITSEVKALKMPQDAAVYIGFDPTAKSLHLGNYTQICILKRFKKAGIRAIAILGGATGMVGDPSFKKSERKFIDAKILKQNKAKIKRQLESFGLETLDNYDFYKKMNVLAFLRDVGKQINLATMLAKESVASRIQSGLSFTEFSYALLQGYDFFYLYKNHKVYLQIGGSDQWGNIVTGIQLIEKNVGKEHLAWGMTAKLLTDANGDKFGKSKGGGALWLDKKMTSPYHLYQFLINQPDQFVEAYLKWMTFLEISEIEKIMEKHRANPQLRIAQQQLAASLVSDIHSPQDYLSALKISNLLFSKENEKQRKLTIKELEILKTLVPGFNFQNSLSETLIEAQIVKSKRELKEFFEDQALEINHQKFLDENQDINWNYYKDILLVKLGKRFFYISR